MSDYKAKMHKVRFPLAIRPKPLFKGLLLREGEGKGEKGRGRNCCSPTTTTTTKRKGREGIWHNQQLWRSAPFAEHAVSPVAVSMDTDNTTTTTTTRPIESWRSVVRSTEMTKTETMNCSRAVVSLPRNIMKKPNILITFRYATAPTVTENAFKQPSQNALP